MVVALSARGLCAWSEWTQALSAAIAAAPERGYFDVWLDALETITVAKGIAGREELQALAQAWRDAAEATPHGAPIVLGRGRAP